MIIYNLFLHLAVVPLRSTSAGEKFVRLPIKFETEQNMYLLEQFLKMLDALWSLGFQLLFIVAIYLIPIFIAHSRKLEKRTSLTVISILLGWTFVGWIVCIAWAILGKASAKIPAEPITQADKGKLDTS